jgi:hypothetical protein
MLDSIILSDATEYLALKLHVQTMETMMSINNHGSPGRCLFNDSSRTLVERIEAAPIAGEVAHETWLLFLPMLADHQGCDACSDFVGRLRDHIMQSALALINATHKAVVIDTELVPPWFAATRVLKSGCVLVTAIRKDWSSEQSWLGLLMKCTEVLTVCAPRWARGNDYCDTWRTICAELNELGA